MSDHGTKLWNRWYFMVEKLMAMNYEYQAITDIGFILFPLRDKNIKFNNYFILDVAVRKKSLSRCMKYENQLKRLLVVIKFSCTFQSHA